MAHKTLIDGTAYEISGGKALVNGTAYSIKNGKTLVGGTAYEIGFEAFTPILDMGVLTFTYSSFFKYYSASCAVDSLPENFTSANALMIGDDIIPMSHSEVTEINGNRMFTFKNYEHTGNPSGEGEYFMSLNVTDLSVSKTLWLYSGSDNSNLRFIIGAI